MNNRLLIFVFLLISINTFSQLKKWKDTILISTTGSDRATHYLESNKIIENDSLIITTILEFDNDKYFNSVYKLNKNNKELTKYSFDVEHKDNHSGAAIDADKEGHIIMVLGAHHGSIMTFISKTPWDITSFNKLKNLEGNYTYPSLTVDKNNDDIYLSLRKTDYKNDWPLCLFVINGNMWEKIGNPIIGNYSNWIKSNNTFDLGHTKGYQNFSSTFRFDKSNRLHLAYRIYEFIPKNKKVDKQAISPYHKFGMSYLVGYTYSDDFGKTWKSAEDNFLNKISPDNALVVKGNSRPELTSSYFEISNLLLWKDEKPVFLIVERKKDKHIVWLSILGDSGWTFKKVKIPSKYVVFGNPRVSIKDDYLTFVISGIVKKDYDRKKTWGGKNNINIFGLVDLNTLKTNLTDIIDVKPSWPAALSLNFFDSKHYPSLLINQGDVETKSGNVYLVY